MEKQRPDVVGMEVRGKDCPEMFLEWAGCNIRTVKFLEWTCVTL